MATLTWRQGTRRYELDKLTIMGRADSAQLILEDETVSRHHAVITRSGEGYYLNDLDSANGVLLNGERVSAPRRLLAGDLLELGGKTFKFEQAHPLDRADYPALSAGPLAEVSSQYPKLFALTHFFAQQGGCVMKLHESEDDSPGRPTPVIAYTTSKSAFERSSFYHRDLSKCPPIYSEIGVWPTRAGEDIFASMRRGSRCFVMRARFLNIHTGYSEQLPRQIEQLIERWLQGETLNFCDDSLWTEDGQRVFL